MASSSSLRRLGHAALLPWLLAALCALTGAAPQGRLPEGVSAEREAAFGRAVPLPTTAPSAGVEGASQPSGPSMLDAILLQAFGWDSCQGGGQGKSWWATVMERVPDIQAAGFTHVWLPPPSQSVAPEGYMPGQLYNLNSSYGSQDELARLNQALLAAGAMPVGDVVINHRCADQQDEQGRWMVYRDDVDHRGQRIDWGEWAIPRTDPVFPGDGQPDSGEDFHPAPDLDHTNQELRDGLVNWLGWLHGSLGFQGWRFDFVKGFAAKYIAEYVERTVGPDAFCVGENWVDLRWDGGHLDYDQEAAVQQLCDWLDAAKFCTLFDFATKGIVQEAVKNTEYDRMRGSQGRGPGLMGAWPGRAVTFVDNHDTGSSQGLWPWPADHVMLGYAYILTHPGVPCVFWEHMFDWGLKDRIAELVALRKRSGIRADSQLETLAAEKDMYVARVNSRVMVKLGPRMDMGDLVPSEREWRLVTWGKDYAVWERKDLQLQDSMAAMGAAS